MKLTVQDIDFRRPGALGLNQNFTMSCKFRSTASIVSLNPSVATTQNSSLSASALDFSNQFGLDSHSYYGTRNSTTLGKRCVFGGIGGVFVPDGI